LCIEAHEKAIAQAASVAASAPGCAFLFFGGLEVAKCTKKARISSGSKFIDPE
jgi:hypothetical protein